MGKKIKLIWDFRGESSQQTAAHHAIHLKEYFETSENLETPTGSEEITAMHAIAFAIVPETQMTVVRDRLKPHRGTLFSE